MAYRLAIIALALALVPLAWAAPPPVPVETTHPVEIIFTQQELGVDVPDTSAATMQFGLIGAIIGTAVSNTQVKNGEQRVAQMRNLLIDYSFDQRMEAALRRKLHESGTIGAQDIKVLHTTWDADATAEADAAGRAFVLAPRYAVNNTFGQMSVALTASLVERKVSARGRPKQKTAFARTYRFAFPLAGAGSGADEDALRWTTFGRPALTRMIDIGIEQVTDMMVYDFSADGRVEAELPIKRMSASVGGSTFAGRKVREGSGWIWVRSGPGALRTLVGHHPVDETIVASLSQPTTIDKARDADATSAEGHAAAADAPPTAASAGPVNVSPTDTASTDVASAGAVASDAAPADDMSEADPVVPSPVPDTPQNTGDMP